MTLAFDSNKVTKITLITLAKYIARTAHGRTDLTLKRVRPQYIALYTRRTNIVRARATHWLLTRI